MRSGMASAQATTRSRSSISGAAGPHDAQVGHVRLIADEAQRSVGEMGRHRNSTTNVNSHILLAVTPREWQQKQYVKEYTLILRAGWLHWLSTSRYHAWSSTSGADGPHDAQVRAVAEADQR